MRAERRKFGRGPCLWGPIGAGGECVCRCAVGVETCIAAAEQAQRDVSIAVYTFVARRCCLVRAFGASEVGVPVPAVPAVLASDENFDRTTHVAQIARYAK